MGIFAKEKIFPALLGQDKFFGFTTVAVVLQNFSLPKPYPNPICYIVYEPITSTSGIKTVNLCFYSMYITGYVGLFNLIRASTIDDNSFQKRAFITYFHLYEVFFINLIEEKNAMNPISK